MKLLLLLIVPLGLIHSVYSCGDHMLHSRENIDILPKFAPIDPYANLDIDPVKGWAVESFGKGAYMATDGWYNTIFLVSNKGVIVVDNPPTIGRKLLYAIGNTTSIPITHVVYSHAHADHIGGVFLYGEKVKRIAHIETAKLLASLNDPNRPVPKITFDDCYTLTVGNQTLQLSYKGLNHLPGNIFIYAAAQKLLMLVDVIYPRWTPFANLGQTKYVPGYIAAHDLVLDYDFDHFVGGHLGPSGNRTDVLIQKQYVLDLKANCEYALNESATNDPLIGAGNLLPPVATLNPGNPWAEFKVYINELAAFCANRTNEKWLGKLAAADVYQYENAETMVESLRIDYGVLGPFGAA